MGAAGYVLPWRIRIQQDDSGFLNDLLGMNSLGSVAAKVVNEYLWPDAPPIVSHRRAYGVLSRPNTRYGNISRRSADLRNPRDIVSVVTVLDLDIAALTSGCVGSLTAQVLHIDNEACMGINERLRHWNISIATFVLRKRFAPREFLCARKVSRVAAAGRPEHHVAAGV